MKGHVWYLFPGIILLLSLYSVAEQPFSRSAWIGRKMQTFLFSQSVIPTNTLEQESLPPSPPFQFPFTTITEVQVSHDFFHSTTGEPETEAEPMIALNPRRPANLLAGYQEARYSNGGAEVLVYAFSFDYGAHWTEKLVPDLTVASGGSIDRASDPWVAFGPHNDVYFASIAFNQTTPLSEVDVSASYNGGKSFNPPVAVISTSSVDEFNDKDAVVVDNTASSPWFGQVYVAWDQIKGNQVQMLVAHSNDQGRTFNTTVVQTSQTSGIGIIPFVDSSGVVSVIWLSLQTDQIANILFSRSTDGGATWSAPISIAKIQERGVPNLRTGGLPAVAIDRKTGAIYVVWPDSRFSKTTDQIAISYSTDAGTTWSKPAKVSDGPKNRANFTPAVAINGHGEAGTCYYSLRNDPAGRYLVDEYIQISKDHGQTFLPAERITSQSFDVRYAARARGFFLGDYQGIAADSRSFHPLWIATLNASKINPSKKQPDVFTTRFKSD